MALDPIDPSLLKRSPQSVEGPGYSDDAEGNRVPELLGQGHAVFMPFDATQIPAANANPNYVIFAAPYAPDYWIISLPTTAAISVKFYCAESPGGAWPDAWLGPGGYAILPGRGIELAAVAVGSSPAIVAGTILACANIGIFEPRVIYANS